MRDIDFAPADANADGPAARAVAAARSSISVSLADLVPALGAAVAADPRFSSIMFPVRRLRARETLHRGGDRFDAIYVVRSGFLKTVSVDAAGGEVVLAFPMEGEVLGLDGLASGRYAAEVVALDVSHVALLPYARLVQLGRDYAPIEHAVYGLLSRQLVGKREMINLLSTRNAESRVAVFLLDLSARLGDLGYSRRSFALRMTRAELGSHLGIRLETVSRILSAFAEAGLLTVEGKRIGLRDPVGLRRIIAPLNRTAAAGPARCASLRSAALAGAGPTSLPAGPAVAPAPASGSAAWPFLKRTSG
jgi:CRP/FNR family transcriptional regulator